MKHHDLKIWPPFLDDIGAGRKLFDVRRDDRGFAVGDTLTLKEWNPRPRGEIEDTPFEEALMPIGYTGRSLDAEITYILNATACPAFGICDGFVVLGIKVL